MPQPPLTVCLSLSILARRKSTQEGRTTQEVEALQEGNTSVFMVFAPKLISSRWWQEPRPHVHTLAAREVKQAWPGSQDPQVGEVLRCKRVFKGAGQAQSFTNIHPAQQSLNMLHQKV